MPTPPETPQPRAAVVYNPIKIDLEKLKKIVTIGEKAAGYKPTHWYPTTKEDAGQGMTATAIAKGASVVLAAGGDGTVRAVAEALRGTDVSLALIPSGTGNILARNIGVTLSNVTEAVTIAFTGNDRRIDMGMIEINRENGESETHAYVVMAGLGIDAKMIANTNSKLKKAVGWLAYVDGIARSLPELHPVKVTYSLDGAAEKEISAHSVMVGNCGLLPGNFLLIPDAEPDDGRLDIVVLRPRGPFGWLKVWNKVAWENGVLRKSAIGRSIIDVKKDARDVLYVTGTDIRMRIDSPEEFQLDGDEFGEVVGAHSWIEPASLTVKVPS